MAARKQAQSKGEKVAADTQDKASDVAATAEKSLNAQHEATDRVHDAITPDLPTGERSHPPA